MHRLLLLLLFCLPAAPAAAQIVINELDADTPGTDTREFVELYNGGPSVESLDGYVLVFFNGNGDASYYAIDLDGYAIEAGGFLLLGNPDVAGTSITFPQNTLQNGADAVAVYSGSASDFPRGTAPTTTNLLDAIVYGTADPDDAGLLTALGESVQYNEAAHGNKDNHSIQRSPDGSESIIVAAPTPMGAGAGKPTVSFALREASALEGATVSVDITIENKPDTDVAVDVALVDSLSADASDFGGFTTRTVTFAGDTDGTVQSLSFAVTDDGLLEPLEGAVFALQNAEGAVIGDDPFILLIEPSDVPVATQRVLFPGVTEQALLDSLRAEYSPAQTLGYDRGRDTLYAVVEAERGYVADLYTGKIGTLATAADPSTTLFRQGINAEHVYPQSKGMNAEPQRSDLHNLFPSDADANSIRGNYPFAEIADASASSWFYRGARYSSPLTTTRETLYSKYASSHFEPKESSKGDVARAMMYVYVIWAGSVDQTFFDQQKDQLIAWHYADPADSLEHRRTLRVADYQGNVNPFVVDSTLARRLWDVTASAISAPADGSRGTFELLGNYPNPFNTSTAIRFNLPAAARVLLTIYDVMGREVMRLDGGVRAAGAGQVMRVNADSLAAGAYFYHLHADAAGETHRAAGQLLLVK